jgi:hypothetical protein
MVEQTSIRLNYLRAKELQQNVYTLPPQSCDQTEDALPVGLTFHHVEVSASVSMPRAFGAYRPRHGPIPVPGRLRPQDPRRAIAADRLASTPDHREPDEMTIAVIEPVATVSHRDRRGAQTEVPWTPADKVILYTSLLSWSSEDDDYEMVRFGIAAHSPQGLPVMARTPVLSLYRRHI